MKKRRLTFAESVLVDLLNNMPSYECNDFGHNKRDQHGYLDECPVERRFRNAEIKARAYIHGLTTAPDEPTLATPTEVKPHS